MKTRLKYSLALLLTIALVILSGCSPAATMAAPQSAPAAGAPAAPAEKASDSYTTSNAAGGASTGASSAPADGERLVIRNANLTIVVEDPAKTLEAVMGMTNTMQGFVVTSNLYKVSGRNGEELPAADITVRVPAEKLNDALAQIKGLVKDPGKDVTSETVSGQDVTKEYTDLNSRVNSLEAKAKTLREIMGAATKTEDVMSVYQQVAATEQEIEVLKGQIQYYKESAAMSAIAVKIQALASIQPIEIGGWQPVGVARDAVQALISAVQVLGTMVIWLALFILPIGVLIILPIWGLVWLIRRMTRSRKTPAPAPPAAQ